MRVPEIMQADLGQSSSLADPTEGLAGFAREDPSTIGPCENGVIRTFLAGFKTNSGAPGCAAFRSQLALSVSPRCQSIGRRFVDVNKSA